MTSAPMKVNRKTQQLAGLGGAKWDLHFEARRRAALGEEIFELTIGEPDLAMSAEIAPAITAALDQGRVGYSNGRGETAMLEALAARYSARAGRTISTQQFLALPGTQTALFALMSALCEAGDEVILFDPYYATYEGVIVSSGASVRAVPLNLNDAFALDFDALEAAITPNTRAILLNSPHNPSGVIFTEQEIQRLGELALSCGLWLVCDEVYESLTFDRSIPPSPITDARFADTCFICSSISKSHAAPGLRAGWILGPEPLITQILPLAETMLFGNQPFIADATAVALTSTSDTAAIMAATYSRRAQMVVQELSQAEHLHAFPPQSGMFLLVDVSATGLTGATFAKQLLDAEAVALMPGGSFGENATGWVRLSLTVPDDHLTEAARRIARFANALD